MPDFVPEDDFASEASGLMSEWIDDWEIERLEEMGLWNSAEDAWWVAERNRLADGLRSLHADFHQRLRAVLLTPPASGE